ncbi:MAG TPA: RHS repeat-associated core domain-containing protein, partial [bacterium]|nr:RHS repeat-associated core domain-containing protein [bacterium]
ATNSLGSFTYSYDPNSARLTNVAYPNGQSVTMNYFGPTSTSGASGSVSQITNLGSAGATLSSFGYTYNPTGEINTWTQVLGSNTNAYAMNYDPDSELQAVTLTSGTTGFDGLSSANQSVSYGYDAAGNRTTENAPSYLHTFGTNSLNQLTNETDVPISIVGSTSRAASVTVNGQGVTENSSYGFSTTIQPASGATTPLTVVQVATDGTVNTVRNHIQNSPAASFDYNGNLLNDGTRSYLWDAANRLVQVNILNPQPSTVADNIEMTYDGFGRRVSITERHGTTVLTAKTFIWCGVKLCQQRDVTGHTVVNRFFAQGEQISGTNYYFAKDHLGNIREVTDSSGNLQASYDYDLYGRQAVLSQAVTADFGYTGMYMERAAGLDLTLYRAYDANKGRWLSRDPLLENAGLNLYEYLGNNSVKWIDSLGLIEPDDPTGPPEMNAANQIPSTDPDGGGIANDLNPQNPNEGEGLSFQGPSGTRIFQISYDCQPILRLDYGPYRGTHGEPRLHLHLPTLFPDVHIPLDPRSWFD